MYRCPSLASFSFSIFAALCAWPMAGRADDPALAIFSPLPAPAPAGLLLKPGDRLAICGDSITQQKMYSRIMETYLTVCVPDLAITVRQYGWSGERAGGFLGRMANDCLRFTPTIATTCYGMNDCEYKPYEDRIGDTYRDKTTAVVDAFEHAGARVVVGSPGIVGKMPSWVKTAKGTVDDLNGSLCKLRNIDIEIAAREHAGFADIFWPMITAAIHAHEIYGPEYAVSGKDGVHPGWAGHTLMAYAFLKGLGLDGNIGTLTVDLAAHQATGSEGHTALGFENGEAQFKSSRYPFCAAGGEVAKDDNIRSGMTLIPFEKDLNRLTLIVKGGKAANYEITWGVASRTYTADELARGVNLADDFPVNPFSEAFKKVDDAVAAKQAYEQKEIQQIFHALLDGKFKTVEEIKDPEIKELFALRTADGALDRDAIIKAAEATRAPLAEAVKTAFVPVTHTIKIVAK
jgi:GDSL-like Lipase/Acylhydrolase family